MDGFKAYKFYLAVKLHFTSPKYDVFKSNGRVRCTIDQFQSRNDRFLFEKLGNKFSSEREYIQFLASNFMYRNASVVYSGNGDVAYKEFVRRKQSITKIFADDLSTIVDSGAQYKFTGQSIPDVVQLWLADKITVETMVILDSIDGFVDVLLQDTHIALLLGDDLMRIQKSRKFVRYDSTKVMVPYLQFIDDMKEENGTHVQAHLSEV